MLEKITITGDQVLKAFQDANMSEKKIESLSFETSETPLSGTIMQFDPIPREYRGNKYFVYKVADANGNEIGEISVNRFFDTEVKQNDILICGENSPNAGRAMLRSHRINSTKRFGKSPKDQISGMIGATYMGERVKVYQPVDYKTALFSTKKSYKNESEVEQEVKDKLWKNTQVNEKAIKITFE